MSDCVEIVDFDGEPIAVAALVTRFDDDLRARVDHAIEHGDVHRACVDLVWCTIGECGHVFEVRALTLEHVARMLRHIEKLPILLSALEALANGPRGGAFFVVVHDQTTGAIAAVAENKGERAPLSIGVDSMENRT